MPTYRTLAHIYDDNWEDKNQFKTLKLSEHKNESSSQFEIYCQEEGEENEED